jgi:hypothetical protein
MNRILLVSMLVLAACTATGGGARVRADAPARQCGAGFVWEPPNGNIASAVAGETRDLATIATQLRVSALAVAAHNVCVAQGGVFPTSITPLLRGPTRHVAISERCGLTKDDATDSWGRPIFFGVVAGSLVVASAGVDGVFGTADDIGSPTAAGPHARRFTSPDSSFCRTR